MIVRGVVLDEEDLPVAGATVLNVPQYKATDRNTTITDAGGAFAVQVESSEHIFLEATHPAFGGQWSGGVHVPRTFVHMGPASEFGGVLRLRRGDILRGSVLDPEGHPVPDLKVGFSTSYVGSGPHVITVHTDREGRFAFERMVLGDIYLSLQGVSPTRNVGIDAEPGSYLFAVHDATWLEELHAGRSIVVRTIRRRFVPLRMAGPGFADRSCVWVSTRSAAWAYGDGPVWNGGYAEIADDALTLTLEDGIEIDVWVQNGQVGPDAEQRGISPTWSGTPTADSPTIAIAAVIPDPDPRGTWSDG